MIIVSNACADVSYMAFLRAIQRRESRANVCV